MSDGAGNGPVRLLVPWRTDPERQRIWDFCRPRWEALGIPIHTADAGGTFNRATSINLAAEGSWDVAVILDADVVAPVEQVYRAIETARRTGRMTLGFTRYRGLRENITKRILDGWDGDWSKGIRFRSDHHESSIVAVPRELWDKVRGFDERFRGWGQEDVAFAHACRILGGRIERIEGTVWHLWHPHSPARNRSRPEYHAAQVLGRRYRAVETPAQLYALLEEDWPMAEAARHRAFAHIWQQNRWNGTETRSGPGSGTEATTDVADWLQKVVADFGITSVLDAGCGEGMWQPDLPGYIGVDLVPEAIATARKLHPDRTYGLADICMDTLPQADAVLCRDALQHLPLEDCKDALANFRRTGARYLIASTHQGEANTDIPAGSWYPCNLQAPPFDFGEPLDVLFDGHWEGVDFFPSKVIGVWTL